MKNFRIAGILMMAIMMVFIQCSKKKDKADSAVPAFNPDVAAFTSGLISNGSVVTVRLSRDMPGEFSGPGMVEEGVFVFEPLLRGSTWRVDSRTIEFRPEARMESGRKYTVKFRLSKVFPDERKLQDFVFSFHTIPMDLEFDLKGLKAYQDQDLSKNALSGTIKASDHIDGEVLEKMVSASQGNRSLPIIWQHEGDGKTHSFAIDSVWRRDKTEAVLIRWENKELKLKGEKEFAVPAPGDFVLTEHKVVQQPEQYILLRFSDPLRINQDLDGLIHLDNGSQLRFTIDHNEIKAFPQVRQSGTMILYLEPGIQNAAGYKFPGRMNLSLNFEELKPAIRLSGNGVILPESNGLMFPFEAVNLKAVDVKVVKIYEDNVGQFLQVNTLGSARELKRAGRLIVKRTIQLIPNRPINFGEWNAFSLDLTNLIKAEPGAIYRVELSFRRSYSMYPCSGQAEEVLTGNEEPDEAEMAYWDAEDGYYDYDYEYEYYDWYEKDDPCTDSYYNYYERKVARNVLASNLGIIAREGTDRSMLFVVTDLRTTESLSGVKLDIFNFQNRLLASLTTGSDGTASVKLEETPYLLIAGKDKQRGYLKLDKGSALSYSQFDVSGTQTLKGIKGLIYGERGVWRPGDSIYLHFILEDKSGTLPPDHPVSLEFTDPRGKLRTKLTRTSGLNGFYSFRLATRPEDETGTWNARVSIAGESFYHPVRVETIKPNRLKINLGFPGDRIGSDYEKTRANLEVKWLHGAPAGNLKARVDLLLQDAATVFEGYSGYTFNDLTKKFIQTEQTIYDGTLDVAGRAGFVPDLSAGSSAPGNLRAVFITRAFEEGGDFSTDRISIPFSPYKGYTGIRPPETDRYGMLVTDTAQVYSVVTLTEEGKPVGRKNLDVKVYKLEWSWWWHASEADLGAYSGNSYYKPVYTAKLQTGSDGKGTFGFRVNYPEWGRYLVIVNDPSTGHSTSLVSYFDWPGYAGRASRRDPQAAGILSFSSDKTKYNAGETATIRIPGSEKSRIFLSIENGTKVLNHYWIKASGEETSFSFTVTADMAPNVYINACLLQPHGQTANDLPIRMYGVIPILVEDKNTKLEPLVNVAEVLRPETTAELRVKEKSGKEMTYTLAMVDEGLLDLTRFRTPDPWGHFYAREALGVRSYDFYDLVMGAYGGRIDGIFSIGGDEEGDGGEAKKSANRFPPVVRVAGPFQLKAGKENVHKMDVPNYVGSVRIMVVAGQKGAYGSYEKAVPVRKPLMVLATLPRVLGPGEEVDLNATVFAMEEKIRNVELKLTHSEHFTSESSEKQLSFEGIGDKTASFRLKVKELTGTGKVKIEARSGKEEAWSETELEIRNPNPPVTTYTYGIIEPGESWEKEVILPGMKGQNTGMVEVSSIPPFDLGRRLKFLLQYPYGCIEQTTSAAFPQLYLEDVMDVTDHFRQKVQGNVQAGIDRIGLFQLSSGGMSYWPGGTIENDWGTSYAGHFLLEAREKGYEVPQRWIDSWLGYQSKTAKNWTGRQYESAYHLRDLELMQAYRLYTLALAGKPETGAMNRLRERPNLSNQAIWRLAAAYALAGQKETAQKISQGLSAVTEDYPSSPYTYGSGVRDQALILETMQLLGMKEQAVPLLLELSGSLSSDRWMSTQSTAYSLIAITSVLGKDKTSKSISFDYGRGSGKTEHHATQKPVAQLEQEFKMQESERYRIANKGTGTLFVRISTTGIPLTGRETAVSSNLRMEVHYFDMKGKSLDVRRLEQGRDFMAVVRITHPGNLGYYNDLALNQIFPSGWEISNQRLLETETGGYDQPDYQDIRDDRVYSFFNLYPGRQISFAVKLTAAYTGRYYLPGISCGAMYRDDIQAMVPGTWVEVVKP